MMRARSIGATLSLLSVVGGAAIWLGQGTREPPTARRSLVSPYFDVRPFARSASTVDQSVADTLDSQIIVIPHHLLAAPLIASALREVGRTRSVHRVILIGPNHVGTGHSDIATTILAWQTPFGDMSADTTSVNDLESLGIAAEEPDVLLYEHSISGMIPVLARYFPGARVLPLALRGVTSPARVAALARSVAGLLDGSTLVIAAVDFAHDIDAVFAPERDHETAATMRSGNIVRMLSYGNEHVDSPQSIAVAMIVARLSGATTFRVLAESDSSKFGGPRTDATSYVVAAWLRV